MDKILRSFILGICLLTSLIGSGQTWNTVTRSQMGSPFAFTYAGGGGQMGTRYFKINPYDNSLWFAYSNKIQRLSNTGTYQVFDTSNAESLVANSKIMDFAFTSDYSFVMDGNYGLQQYDGVNWNLAVPFSSGLNLAADGDSVWCIRTNQNYMKWYGGFNSQGNFNGCRRAISKNGIFWGAAGGNIGLFTLLNDISTLYSPDTCMLIDWDNYDFKFCKNTDSMYVACTGGLSIADGKHFIDSICMTNSTNMPAGIIVEFEFDENDNIWALFGSSNFTVNSMAFLNTTTKVWSNFYDGNNSPIEFNSTKVSLEIDTLGNVWVIDNHKLNVLDFGNAPVWLGVEDSEIIPVSLYPNPTSDLVTISFEGTNAHCTIYDTQGKLIQTSSIVSGGTISLKDVQTGVYFFELTTENGKTVKRVVKN